MKDKFRHSLLAPVLLVFATLAAVRVAQAQNLTVNASSVVRTIDPRMYGINVEVYDANLPDPSTIAALQLLQTPALRFPEGAESDQYNWQTGEDIPYNFQWNGNVQTFANIAESVGVGGNAYIGVNYGDGTPEQAAAWVAYYNGSPASTAAIGNGLDALGRGWHTVGYWASIRAAAPLSVDDGLNFLRASHPAPYGFKYWEVGNEIYDYYSYANGNSDPVYGGITYDRHGIAGSGLPGLPNDPYTYALNFPAFYNAMKAVDPTIKIGINCVPGEDASSPQGNPNYTNPNPKGVKNLTDGTTHYGWTPVVLATLNSLPTPVLPDFIFDHIYPQDPGSENDATLLAAGGSRISEDNASFKTMFTDYLGTGGDNIELDVTELNSTVYNIGKQTVSLVNALFMADALGQLANTSFNSSFWWDLRDGSQSGNNNSASLYGWRQFGDYGILASGDYQNTPLNTAYPTYFAALLMTHWGRGGDQVVTAGSANAAVLSVYAALLANGNLSLLVVNKDITAAHAPQITLNGFTPGGTGTYYSFGENNDAPNVETAFDAANPLNTGTFPATLNDGQFSYTFPKYSVTVLVIPPPAPGITSLSPSSGTVGTVITVNGQNLTGASVTFNNNVPASPVSVNQAGTVITVTVPAGATTGPITVTTGGGTVQSASFTVTTVTPPVISSIPTSGLVGTAIEITGQNFTGATIVAFNGVAASFTVVSATEITAVVPATATSGTIAVTTPDGTAVSGSSFTVLALPVNGTIFTTLGGFDLVVGGPGGNPRAGVILSGNTLYGTAEYGGLYERGTVFYFNLDEPRPRPVDLYDFNYNAEGIYPEAPVALSGQTLYGATTLGVDFLGSLFAVNIQDGLATSLIPFGTPDGGYYQTDGSVLPSGVIVSGTTLYGTAERGGPSGPGAFNGNGTVFKINTDGTGFTILYGFSPLSVGVTGVNSDGANPQAGLILSGNTLYGTTSAGGASGNGTVFAVNTDGTGFVNLHNFTALSPNSHGVSINGDGANPFAGLILSGGTLYGTTTAGGSSGKGTVFAVNINANAAENSVGFTNLHSFTAFSPNSLGVSTNGDGALPYAGLTIAGNTLYGVASAGGSSGNGAIFSVNVNGGGFTNLYDFTALNENFNSDGAAPDGTLLIAGNTLYGTAFMGGFAGVGTVFSLALPPRAEDQATAPPGQTAAVVLPAPTGLAATLHNNSGGSESVTAMTYAASPAPDDSSAFGLGTTYLDLEVSGATTADSLTAIFSYAGTTAPTLEYYTGSQWEMVESSGPSAPAVNASSHQITVVFDQSSIPPITQLTGTMFALATSASTTGTAAPSLAVALSASSVTVSWPVTEGYTLQQNSSLSSPAGWATSGSNITTVNGTNSITITPPVGNVFFRLSNP